MKATDQLEPSLINLRYTYKQFIHFPEASAIVYFSEIIQDDPDTPVMGIGYRNKKKICSFCKRFSSKKAMLEYVEKWIKYRMEK